MKKNIKDLMKDFDFTIEEKIEKAEEKRKEEIREKKAELKFNPNKHIHKYERMKVNWKTTEYLYKCRDNCNSYTYPSEIVGKVAICWNCERPFKIQSETIERCQVKPNCGCKILRNRLADLMEKVEAKEKKEEKKEKKDDLDWMD